LADIRSSFRYATAFDPLWPPIAPRTLAIPSKRFELRGVGYLQPSEVRALLDAPDLSTRAGLRGRVLLTLMYNTGARFSEAAGLKVGDLRLDTAAELTVAALAICTSAMHGGERAERLFNRRYGKDRTSPILFCGRLVGAQMRVLAIAASESRMAPLPVRDAIARSSPPRQTGLLSRTR
jgi:integrase